MFFAVVDKEVREIEIIVDNTEEGCKINLNTYNIKLYHL